MLLPTPDQTLLDVIYNATTEVASAVITAVTTTIISFLPVFTMVASEGKLFKPLAYTKTFTLIASIIITITLIPPFAHWLFSIRINTKRIRLIWNSLLFLTGIGLIFLGFYVASFALIGFGLINGLTFFLAKDYSGTTKWLNIVLSACIVIWLLTHYWLPLGPSPAFFSNLIFVVLLIGSILLFFWLVIRYYEALISWCLDHKLTFLSAPVFLILFQELETHT